MIWSCNSLKFYKPRSAGQGAASLVLLASLVFLAACAQVPLPAAAPPAGAGPVGARAAAPTAAPTAASPPTETAPPASAPSVAQGWRILFDQRLGNCAACHSIPDQKGAKSGIQSTFAPALDGVAARYSPAQLRQWVVDARQINPNTLMPPFGQMLTPQQVTDVLAALQTLR